MEPDLGLEPIAAFLRPPPGQGTSWSHPGGLGMVSGPCRSSDTPVWRLHLAEICQPVSADAGWEEGAGRKEGRPRIGTRDTDFLRSQILIRVERVDD